MGIPTDETGDDLEAGQWISEPVLWTHWMHRGILTATSDCRLCLLDAFKFQDTIGGFDHEDFNPKVYAAGFVEGLNNSKDLTDIACGLEAQALASLVNYIEKLGQAKMNAVAAKGRRQS